MDDVQKELPLPFPELSADLPLLAARMVNEYQYCARLAYLEWVQGEWSDWSDTVEGRYAHRKVDKPGGDLPNPADAEQGERVHARSITLSSNRLGLIVRRGFARADAQRDRRPAVDRCRRHHPAAAGRQPEMSAMLAGQHLPAR